MKIGVDISQLQYGSTGITNYLLELIQLLSKKNNHIFFKNYRGLSKFSNVKSFPFPFTTFKRRRFWDNHIIGNLAKFYKVDILITSYFATPKQKHLIKIPVIYDLGIYGKDPKDSKSIDYFKNAIENSMKRSNAIITISDTIA
ncbi:hypothetical protein J7L48_10060, partial [bacterium]|nr:hypothetical protein [bacterium]